MSESLTHVLRIAVVLLAGALIIGYLIGRDVLRQRRLRRLGGEPIPDEWLRILEQNVPLYRRLPDDLKHELHRQLKVFLAERRLEGCGGLEITDAIRVTIGAQACMLILGRRDGYRRTFSSVLVYPHHFVVPRRVPIGGGSHLVEPEERLGESWRYGEVVLAWDEVKQGPEDRTDGRNVVFHEFAHQLDQEDGFSDGVPILDRRSDYATWARILGTRYEELRRTMESTDKDKGGTDAATPATSRTVLDPYGATDPAEFFAVATEAFFEKPEELKRELPDLYEELRKYYRLDPAEWSRLRRICVAQPSRP